MIYRGIRILIVFHLYCCSKHNGLRYFYSKCCEPCSFCLVNILIENTVKFFRVFYLPIYYIYNCIIVMGHSTASKNCHITPLPPHNSRLSTTATFFSPWGGRCGEVWLYYQLTSFLNVLTARFRNLEWSYPVIPSRVSWSATAWNKQLPSPGISPLILRPERFIFSSSWRLCPFSALFSSSDCWRNLLNSDRFSFS